MVTRMVSSVDTYVYYLNLIPSLILFLVGVPANLLIIYYFSFHKKKKMKRNLKGISVYDLLILQIAITDLLTCLIRATSIVVVSAVGTPTSSRISDVVCRFVWSVPFAASDVSVCLLFILSLDRYLRIAYPFRKRFSKVIIHVAFLVTWPLSGFLCVYYYYWRSIDYRGNGLCLGLGDPPFPVVVSTIVVNMFGMFLIPVIGIIWLFQRSSRILKHQSQFVDKVRQKEQPQNEEPLPEQQTTQLTNHNITAMNTLRCLTVVMFLTVALPKISLSFLHFSFHSGMNTQTFAIFESCVTSIVLINSGVNIFPYLYYIKDFRTFVWNLLL